MKRDLVVMLVALVVCCARDNSPTQPNGFTPAIDRNGTNISITNKAELVGHVFRVGDTINVTVRTDSAAGPQTIEGHIINSSDTVHLQLFPQPAPGAPGEHELRTVLQAAELVGDSCVLYVGFFTSYAQDPPFTNEEFAALGYFRILP
jgi:hypothetical protein